MSEHHFSLNENFPSEFNVSAEYSNNIFSRHFSGEPMENKNKKDRISN